MKINLNDEIVDIEDVNVNSDSLPSIQFGLREYYLAKDFDQARELCLAYWEDLANNYPREFTDIIGTKRLVKWALKQSDDFGISSIDEFFDVASGYPEEHFASYDFTTAYISFANKLNWNFSDFKTITDIDVYVYQLKSEILDLTKEELEEEINYWKEFKELCEEIGFVPTIAYRVN